MKISAIPALETNYIWAISKGNVCYLVDPGEATPSLEYIEAHQFELQGILLTHRHYDHIAGVDEIIQKYPCPVIGPKSDGIPQVTQFVSEGSTFSLFDTQVTVFDVPGHTPEHVMFFIEGDQAPLCFSGDALFAAGCGNRMLDADTMYRSLQKFKNLPPTTLIYCGHEYTLNNLRFALAVEPHNSDIHARKIHIEQLLNNDGKSLPSVLQEELATNPFLRTEVSAVIDFARRQPAVTRNELVPVEVFARLRDAKDQFR